MKDNIFECPVSCKYCMASKIDSRKEHWEAGSRIGINKSCVFINRLPKDPPLKDMNFKLSLFDGDYLGFQGITDCFWMKYFEDLSWLIDKVENSKVRKLVLTSKIPVNEKQIELLKRTNKILVIYSLTGLDQLEKTTTMSRINAMIRLREEGIDTFGIIHPYIHNYSDLSFLKELEKNNFTYISYKGFRYNPKNMKELEKYISPKILKQYEDNEKEVLIGKEYIDQQLKNHNLKYINLKEYIRKDNGISFNLDKAKVVKQVEELLEKATISSSEQNYEILKKDIIERRLR